MKLYKLEKHNKIHREGFKAGYAKAKKEIKEIREEMKKFAPIDHSHSLIPHRYGDFYPESGGKTPFN